MLQEVTVCEWRIQSGYMILAAISGTLILIGFLAFFYNIVMSVGLKGVLGIFTPSKIKTKDLVPASWILQGAGCWLLNTGCWNLKK